MNRERQQFYEFGDFRLYPDDRLLSRDGEAVTLTPKCFDILQVLVERSGYLVEKEELMKAVWPDAFVEEGNLTQSISLLRRALGDNPDGPHYIETIPRYGYRFVAPVKTQLSELGTLEGTVEATVSSGSEQTSQLSELAVHRRGRKLAIAGTIGIILVGMITWFTWPRFQRKEITARNELSTRRLTANSPENAVLVAAISPDGKYLAYADTLKDNARIFLRIIATGQTHPLPVPDGSLINSLSWFPDGTQLLAGGHTQQPVVTSLWSISILGGMPLKLRDDASWASVSPDGSLVAYLRGSGGREIWLMDQKGEDPRRLRAVPEGYRVSAVKWSPNGRRIAYLKVKTGPGTREATLESCDLKGGRTSLILSDPRLQRLLDESFCWAPDGRIIFSLAESSKSLLGEDSNLWEIRVDPEKGEPSEQPKRITRWPGFNFAALSVTVDGKSLAFIKQTLFWDVYVGNLEAKRRRLKSIRRLTLDDRRDWPTGWTLDSRAILFTSDRNGTWDIFKQPIDQNTAEELVHGPENEVLPRLGPDGSWILYGVGSKADDYLYLDRLMRVPIGGGPPELILRGRNITKFDCARAPSTLCVMSERVNNELVFSAFDAQKGRDRELFRVERDPWWELSPDGSLLAVFAGENDVVKIRIFSSAGELQREMPQILGRFWGAGWSHDGQGLYVATGTRRVLLYIGLENPNQEVVSQQETWFPGNPTPSPDGRHLALLGFTQDFNVWMLENF